MRDAINKQISYDEILRTAQEAKKAGWRRIKLYFMVGFPNETEEDIREIGELVKAIKKVGFMDITASINLLIPKPHTAFQFAKLQPPEYMDMVKKILNPYKKFGKLDINDGKKSFVEGILSRGDRLLFQSLKRHTKLVTMMNGVSIRELAKSQKTCDDFLRYALENTDKPHTINKIRDLRSVIYNLDFYWSILKNLERNGRKGFGLTLVAGCRSVRSFRRRQGRF